MDRPPELTYADRRAIYVRAEALVDKLLANGDDTARQALIDLMDPYITWYQQFDDPIPLAEGEADHVHRLFGLLEAARRQAEWNDDH